MNTPAPSIPLTNNTAPKDNHELALPSVSGTLKTTIGDVALSLPPTSAEAASIQFVALTQIFAQMPVPVMPAPSNRQQPEPSRIIFLPPEAVEIEIQITDLLQNLETSGLCQEKTAKNTQKEENTTQETKGWSSIFTPVRKEQPHRDFTPSPLRGSPSLKYFDKPDARAPIKQRPSSSLPHASAPAHASKKEPAPLSKLTSLHTSPFAQTTAEERESSEVRESTYASSHQDQQKQGQGHHSDEHKEQDQQQKKEKKISAIEEESTPSISLAEILHLYETSPNKVVGNEKSKPFQKKAQSPMSLFTASNATPSEPSPEQEERPPERIDNVFLRFMQLMSKILGQAEAEAQELYLRVKARTDDIDKLTLLVSKINAEKSDINWEHNSEMLALLGDARRLGATIPENTYKWSKEEKKTLKENILMRKENMEKITQLERTDMQRYLQEVSQCHQARSNVLKLLKELMDTFIHNLRP